MEELEKLQTENKNLSDLIEKMKLDYKRTFDKYCQITINHEQRTELE